MKRSDLTSKSVPQSVQSGDKNGGTKGIWLNLARGTWIALVGPSLALFFASLPGYFAALHVLCPCGSAGLIGQLSTSDLRTLQTFGISLDFYATVTVAFLLLFQLICTAVGVLIFWRKSDDRFALFVSFALVMFPFSYTFMTLKTLPSSWSWVIPLLVSVGSTCSLLGGYIFPNGRFAPRWMRWFVIGALAYWVVISSSIPFTLSFSRASRIFNLPLSTVLLLFVLISSNLLVLVYRYRRVSTARERQQIKWVVYGVVLMEVCLLASNVLYLCVFLSHFQASPLTDALLYAFNLFAVLFLPLSYSMAILRSRLWDIDILINRTIVYSTLTASLALIYIGLILALQYLLRGSINQNNAIALVGSTLAIAALFQPLRKRIQQVIDQRFYRRKYDAAQTVAAFSATLREEVDLNQLRERLVKVVEETMQPTHVFLWLRDPERKT